MARWRTENDGAGNGEKCDGECARVIRRSGPSGVRVPAGMGAAHGGVSLVGAVGRRGRGAVVRSRARVRVLLIKGARAETCSDLLFCKRLCVGSDTSTCGFVPRPTQEHRILPRKQVQTAFVLVRCAFACQVAIGDVSASTPGGHADRDKGPRGRGQSRLGFRAPHKIEQQEPGWPGKRVAPPAGAGGLRTVESP